MALESSSFKAQDENLGHLITIGRRYITTLQKLDQNEEGLRGRPGRILPGPTIRWNPLWGV